jgi:hypothetical protein
MKSGIECQGFEKQAPTIGGLLVVLSQFALWLNENLWLKSVMPQALCHQALLDAYTTLKFLISTQGSNKCQTNCNY